MFIFSLTLRRSRFAFRLSALAVAMKVIAAIEK
jgi:hypothetical protein